VVRLCLHDPVAQVTRPVARLIGYVQVLPARGIGALELLFGASYEEIRSVAALHLEDQERAVDHSGVLTVAPHR
jgi:hypothetical protein